MATVSFKYWNDCVDPEDLDAMWIEPDVSTEWTDVGETKGSKVHLSRDPDGHPYLTQTEMKACAGIIVRRHFVSQIDSLLNLSGCFTLVNAVLKKESTTYPAFCSLGMLCAIAELESDRQPLATTYHKKPEEVKMGIMQISPKTAEWLTRERSEEFMIRAYKGGTKKATRKSTLPYWKKYLTVKERLPSRNRSYQYYLGLRTSSEDMEAMWNNPNVNKEWTTSGERKGKVRLS
ncbi:UNVERIFIED_CONTAM: hypothetical protein Sradi_6026700 [Sesamum radiatum]|uniref:Transglycosylase SLT domain-containing protein n=1 Tax=Sesamum radiatum TaxID=300843 RepID=A0AAW2KGW7_SESRA